MKVFKNGSSYPKPGNARLEEWERTRRLGFLSLVIPVSVVGVLSTRTFGGSVQATLNSPWGWTPVQKTILYFTLWGFKVILLNMFKYCLMVHAFGMDKQDYHLIIGPRSNWTGHEVDALCKTYGRKRLKMMDAIHRRFGHTVIHLLYFVFYVYLCENNEIRLKTAILQLPVISALKIITESGHRFSDIGRYIFQGSRVLDGQYGRFNLVVVNVWAYAGRIVMFQLLLRAGHTDQGKGIVLFGLAMMPLLCGDSAGEIIGSFFGKITFQVRGLGEVNSKTVEGTFAVFLSSFVAKLVLFYNIFGLSTASNMFIFHPAFVFFYTCVIAAVIESAAPRGTDNFFLKVLSLVVLMASLK